MEMEGLHRQEAGPHTAPNGQHPVGTAGGEKTGMARAANDIIHPSHQREPSKKELSRCFHRPPQGFARVSVHSTSRCRSATKKDPPQLRRPKAGSKPVASEKAYAVASRLPGLPACQPMPMEECFKQHFMKQSRQNPSRWKQSCRRQVASEAKSQIARSPQRAANQTSPRRSMYPMSLTIAGNRSSSAAVRTLSIHPLLPFRHPPPFRP